MKLTMELRKRKGKHKMTLRMVSEGVIKKAKRYKVHRQLKDDLNGAYWSNSVQSTKACTVLKKRSTRLNKKGCKIKSKYCYRSKVGSNTCNSFTHIRPKDKHTDTQMDEDHLPLSHLSKLSQIKLNQPCTPASKQTNNISSPLHDSHLNNAYLEAFPNFSDGIGVEICQKEKSIGRKLKKTFTPINHTGKTRETNTEVAKSAKHTRKTEQQLPKQKSSIIKGGNSIKTQNYSCKSRRKKQLYSCKTSVFSASPRDSTLRASGNIKPPDECDFTIVECDKEVSFRIPTSSVKKSKLNNSSVIDCNKEKIKMKKSNKDVDSKSNEKDKVDHFVMQCKIMCTDACKENFKERFINETFDGSYIGSLKGDVRDVDGNITLASSSKSRNGRMPRKKRMLYKPQGGVFDSKPDHIVGKTPYICNESCNESIITSALLTGKR